MKTNFAVGVRTTMSYAGTYRGTIHTYCPEFDYTDPITFTIDRAGYIDLPDYPLQGRLNDGRISSSGQISGISITVRSQSLGTITIPYSGTDDGKTFSVSGRSSNGIISTIQATLVVPKYTAVNDRASVTEDSRTLPKGNLLDNDTDWTASIATVKGKAVAASGSTTIAGTYGTLKVAADGSYSYALNNANAKVDALRDGEQLIDTFIYTARNSGNASKATLSVTIYGETDLGTPVVGTGGDDVLYGSARPDAFNGRLGVDTASYARAKAGVTASLADPYGNKGDAQDDTYTSIENLKGSAYADTLYGDYGNNVLDGGAGADRLYGGDGNDVFIVDSAADKVIESDGYGTDTIKASVTIKALAANVEKLVLAGSGSISGTGNGLANTITGNAGSNTIDGGLGKDVLVGGAGKDTFLFKAAPSATNVDHIKDFKPADDTIALENAVFKALTQTGVLSSAAFKDVADGAALDAGDRILYDHRTGKLSYDADGSGAQKAVVIAYLDNHASLTFQDFHVV